MKRSKINLSHYHLTTTDFGKLLPISCVEVLPGDSMQIQSSALVRVTPMLKPVMHPIRVVMRHYYVPMRLLWSGWEDFITGVDATPPPTIAGSTHSTGSVMDHLGIYTQPGIDHTALPIRAYNKIWNEYFRDQDLQSEESEDNTTLKSVCWEKDYYTAARPWPQKGDAVTLPLGTKAPVRGIGKGDGTFATTSISVKEAGGVDTTYANAAMIYNSPAGRLHYVEEDPDNAGYPGIYADLSAAEALNVRDFREAFALQRYQEARARYGSSYVDYLRYLGIRPSDARLQQPEYLGGGVQTISFSEVLNTASNGGTDVVGDLKGHGIAAMRSSKVRRYFEEHGYLMTMMYIRPKAIYCSNMPRKFSRTAKEDFYQRELQNVGMQEIYNKEVYSGSSDPSGIFGYSERYAEYRSEPSRVSGEFRTSVGYDWHIGRIVTSDTALNNLWVKCNPPKRIFADQTNNSFWIMANNDIRARRMISRSGGGALV